MRGPVHRHIRSNAIAYAALFFAMTGSAAAVNKIAQIQNKDIATGAVDHRTLAKNAVHASNLDKYAVRGKKVKPGTLVGSNLANDTVTGQQINESTLDPNILQFRINGNCPSGSAISAVASDGSTTCEPTGQGTLTGVTTSGGLTGGGTSGTVNVGVDPTQVQSRVTGNCSGNNAVQSLNQDGTVTCQPTGTGTVTSVGAGTGLSGGPITTSGSLSVDPTQVQTRVGGTCPGSQAVQSVNQNGTVNCSADLTPASRVLSSGKVNATTGAGPTILSFGAISISAACEADAGEADTSISVSGGTFTFAAESTDGFTISGANLPSGSENFLGRTDTGGPPTAGEVHFSAMDSTGKTINGQVLMIRNSSGSCSYEGTAITGG